MMPEDARDGLFDPDEEFPWDPGLSDAGESEMADRLDEGGDE